MTDMLDIARSGLLAYRSALAVTAENIANVGTDGYRRRDLATVSAPGARATPVTGATGGQGVSVLEVRRAFDALAADRLRSAAGTRAAAEAHQAGAAAVEALMIPGETGIDASLRGFFDAIDTLAIDPARAVARSAAVTAGRELAGALAGLGEDLAALRADLGTRAAAVTAEAAAILQDLADVARRMGGLGAIAADQGAAHPLADRRDALLDALATRLPVSVALSPAGLPEVRLGGAAGPVLLRGDAAARLSVETGDLLTLRVEPPGGGASATRLLARGALAGIGRALGAVDMATAELDGFARGLAAAANAVHRAGVDGQARPGGDLFALAGWQAVPAAGNSGAVQLDLTAVPGAAPAPVTLVYAAATAEWVARDAGGAELARGTGRLSLPGVTVDLAGAPGDGHRIDLVPVTGRARDLAWLVDDPDRLAAAAPLAAAPAAGNAGSAQLSAAPATGTPAASAPLAALLTAAPTDIAAGVAGLVPAGTQALALAASGRPATTRLDPAPGADRLSLAFPGGTQGFDLTGLADAAAVAAALSSGALRSDRGATLSSLGLTVTVEDGALVLARPGAAEPVDATLTGPGLAVVGTGSPAVPVGGTLQVLTRDGRHIAGTPLSAAAAADLLTPANGFRPGAVYDPAPLIPVSGSGYRGVQADLFALPGAARLELPGTGLVTGPALPLPAAAPRLLTLAAATGEPVSAALPEGASAATAARLLQGVLPGLQARAVTALELADLPEGPLTIALQGTNTVPVSLTATVAGGHAGALAQAVNAATGATGIRAELSPDGRRLLLVQEAGHDITLSGLAAGGPLTLRAALADGTADGPATVLAPGHAARLGGRVALDAPQAFSADEGGGALLSQPRSGPVSAATSAAGAAARLSFADVPAGATGGLAFTLTLGGHSAVAAVPPGTAAAGVAAALAASLRLPAPDAVVTGAALPALPPDGSQLALTLDGAGYTLVMQGGVPVIGGPEPGRLTAGFDSANRLVLAARGVTDGRGIAVAAGAGFGLGPAQGTQVITGQPPDAGALPVSVTVSVDGTDHMLVLTGGGVTVPSGFPGLAETDAATGALRLTLAADAAARIGPVAAAGFGGPGIALRAEGGALVLAGEGAALGAGVTVAGALAQSLALSGLPPEDLIVVATGALALSGGLTAGPPPTGPGALDLVVEDAATRRISLRDAVTGDIVAAGHLDAAGRAELGGLALQLQGSPASGDRFALAPAAAGSADAAMARALAALRAADPATGAPGLADRLAALQTDAGIRTAAAGRAQATAAAAEETAQRRLAAIGAVDLDAEAARLVELQQAYQASAQAMTVARDLFDTLLAMF